MPKIAMLLPSQNMMEDAVYAANFYGLELVSLTVMKKGSGCQDAQAAVQAGADIIIARGGQAITIAGCVKLPVVEIRITSHEVALLIEQARRLTEKLHPFIVLTGPENMFVDLDVPVFEKQYGIHFRPYLFSGHERMVDTARQAAADGADVVIGGADVTNYCRNAGIPCLRTASGRESIMEACRTARIVGNALEQEKTYSASLNLILDHTYSGIIQTDAQGLVQRANSFVEHLLLRESSAMEGRPVWDFIPGISEKMMRMVCEKKKGIHAASVRYGKTEFVVSIAPVLVESAVSGTIISFHEGLRLEEKEAARRQELFKGGHRAGAVFESLINRSPVTQELVRRARHYAAFSFPVLLTGPEGCGRHFFAECIHNAGSYREFPFLRINCSGYTPPEAEQVLFRWLDAGTSASLPSDGSRDVYCGSCTLYLHEIAGLSPHAQQRLLYYLQRQASAQKVSSGKSGSGARIIASSAEDLRALTEQGGFSSGLYYALSEMTLEIPPLRERREDVMGWIDYYLKDLQEQYGRYVRLTRDAQEYLTGCSWDGNLLEIRNVCARILVNCGHYSVDAADVEREMDAYALRTARQETPASSADIAAEAGNAVSAAAAAKPRSAREQILNALLRFEGRREPAAAALGISTSTLWRRMKQYRIPKEAGRRPVSS